MPEHIVRKRMRAALADSRSTDEQRVAVAAQLRSTLADLNARSARCYFQLVVLATGFSLLVTADLKELVVFGAHMTAGSSIELLLFISAAIFYYRGTVLIAVATLADHALREFYEKCYPAFYEQNLTELFSDIEFFTVENTLRIILFKPMWFRVIHIVSCLIVGAVVLFGPIVWLAWAALKIFSATNISHWYSVPAIAIVTLIVARSLIASAGATKIAMSDVSD